MLITHEIAVIIILVVPPDCTIVVAKNPQEHAPVAKRPPPGHIHTETEKRGHPVAPPVVERRHSCQPVIPANSRIHRGSPEGGTSAVNGQREARVLWPAAVGARLFRACLVRMRVRVGSGVFWDGIEGVRPSAPRVLGCSVSRFSIWRRSEIRGIVRWGRGSLRRVKWERAVGSICRGVNRSWESGAA